MNRSFPLSWESLRHLCAKWSKDYGSKPIYWRLKGRPVFSVLNLTDFASYYGITTFKLMLSYARHVCRNAIAVDPYIIGVFGRTNLRNVIIANELPLDAATGYALLPTWSGKPIQSYQEQIEQRVTEWYAVQRRLKIPFFPVAAAGWDASVRGERLPSLDASSGFPWVPIVTGVTPQLFGCFLDKAIEFNSRTHPTENVVFIHAWNEWTESSVVEPSDRFGFAFLKEIQKRARSCEFLR